MCWVHILRHCRRLRAPARRQPRHAAVYQSILACNDLRPLSAAPLLTALLLRALQGDQKRLLLAALTKSLSEVLPFLERMLELNFSAAGAAVQAGSREAAQQHVAVIQAALAAANTYAGAG